MEWPRYDPAKQNVLLLVLPTPEGDRRSVRSSSPLRVMGTLSLYLYSNPLPKLWLSIS
jgi:hypothetical protein